jgi:hypothetical protein
VKTTVFNLRNVKLRGGQQFRDDIDVQLDPLVLGGQSIDRCPRRCRRR